MLDQQTAEIEPQNTLAAEDGQDVVGAEDTVAAEEPEIVIAVEGEEPEPDPDEEIDVDDEAYEVLGDKGKAALRKLKEFAKDLRAQKKEAKREAREAKARAAELEAKIKPLEPEIKEPTLEDCGFNEDTFKARMKDFLKANEAREAAQAAKAEQERLDNEAYEAKRKNYFDSRAKMGVDDEAEARVVAKLSPAQQTALMKYASDPTKLVAGLAKSPKMLEELSSIKDIGAFIYRLPTAEGKITVSTKAPPPPESKVRGGGAPNDAVSLASLEKLRAKAEETGDYTAYFAEKRRRNEAGVKS